MPDKNVSHSSPRSCRTLRCRATTVGSVSLLVYLLLLTACVGARRVPAEEFAVMLSAREGGWRNGQQLSVTVHEKKIVSVSCTEVGLTRVVYELQVAEGSTISTSGPEVPGPHIDPGDTLSVVPRYPESQCPASFKRCLHVLVPQDDVKPLVKVVSIDPDGTTKVDRAAVISVDFYFPVETAGFWHLEHTGNGWRLIRSMDEATLNALKTHRGLTEQGWNDDCLVRVQSSRGWSTARIGFPWPSWGMVMGGD